MGQEIEAVAIAQADIDQDQVVGLAIDGGDAFGKVRCRFDLVALFAEPLGHRAEHVAIVVYQKKRGLGFHGGILSARRRRRGLVLYGATRHPSPNIYVMGEGSQQAGALPVPNSAEFLVVTLLTRYEAPRPHSPPSGHPRRFPRGAWERGRSGNEGTRFDVRYNRIKMNGLALLPSIEWIPLLLVNNSARISLSRGGKFVALGDSIMLQSGL